MFRGFAKRRASSAHLDRGEAEKENEHTKTPAAIKSAAKRASIFHDNDRNKTTRLDGGAKSKLNVLNASDGADSVEMTHAFDKLLEELQIPETLRPKLTGMDSTVKAAMLRTSRVVKPAQAVFEHETPKKATGTLRKAKSSDSVGSPRPPQIEDVKIPQRPQTSGRFLGAAMRSSISLGRHSDDEQLTPPKPINRHSRGLSLDLSKGASMLHLPSTSSSENVNKKGTKEKGWSKDIVPSKYVNFLKSSSSLKLDVESVKKLRLLLRNESANWTDTFIQTGGYTALLTRLNEILEVEWREEQHDDQLLHELLRCFKALETSSIGCAALRSASPTPFAQLVRLLFSDKKPGDVATRQLIVDLILSLFDLYPPSSLPSSPSTPDRHREVWDDQRDGVITPSNPALINLPAPHRNIYSLIRALLLTKAPPSAEAPETPLSPHEFIESLHVPRIYKTYLQELSDVCRDYFWVFCHPENTVWNLDDTDEQRVEKPRAPGGMTGGVEFEAMAYLTTHFKLVNAVAKAAADLNLPQSHELSAHRLHSDLFASGFERIILVARKASAGYYPTLHLEIARYVANATQARFELPWTLSRTIGLPPDSLTKSGRGAVKERHRQSANVRTPRGARASPVTPSRSAAPGGTPKIPTPQKVDPLKM